MTGGFFAVLDDIALLLDDAAMMSKVAARKTAGILGDDLAVNAEKATGFRASRELPVLWAITRGSFVNKLIILPLAFLLSAFVPWIIIPILLAGGSYLCFEGVEKIFHSLFHIEDSPAGEIARPEGQEQLEKAKIRSAVRTDFILSIEIIVIALGTVMDQSLVVQIMVVSLVSLAATVGVYGLVALIVRMDDMGFYLIDRASLRQGLMAEFLKKTGSLLVSSLPRIIKALGIIGTAAMLLVGGGIFNHNIEKLHHFLEVMPAILANLVTGLVVGICLLGLSFLLGKLKKLLPTFQ